MIEPLPTQISGAEFLASRTTALLADSPRVGKSGAALLALTQISEDPLSGYPYPGVLIVTTASGRAVWRRAVRDWLGVDAAVIGVDRGSKVYGIQIVSWDQIRQPKIFAELRTAQFTVAICDEDHRAKNPETKTAQAIYGKFNRHGDRLSKGLVTDIPRVWHLTGTPAPHDLGDMWCRLRSSAPDLLKNNGEMPDVRSFEAFRERYCITRPYKPPGSFKTIQVVVGGRNEAELRERLKGWMLRRTQKDVGIRPSVQELMPLTVSKARLHEVHSERSLSHKSELQILEAIETGTTKDLDIALGPLRRITGRIKAEAVVAAAKEWLEDNPDDKLVLAYYHREVGDLLREGLGSAQTCRVDGSTSAKARELEQSMFAERPPLRVFLAQIDAAGEAIDLSAAAELWFCEFVFSPKSMKQMAARISNVNQTKTTFVKCCCIEGSIDESIQASLLRLWKSIKEVVA